MYRIDLRIAFRAVLFAILLIGLLLNGTRHVAGSAGQAPEVKLAWGSFDPLQNDPSRSMSGEWQTSRVASDSDYQLMQFTRPLSAADRDALNTAGVELLAYVPQLTYIVRAEATAIEAAQGFDWVRWVGDYAPAYRVEPELLTNRSAERQILIVTLFPQVDVAGISAEIEALNAMILDAATDDWKTILQIETSLSTLPQIAALEGVNWVEPVNEAELLNATAAQITGVTAAQNPTTGLGLTGEGQLIAVADTGIDVGINDVTQLHPDFLDGNGQSRIAAMFDRVGDGNEDYQGHGTHVAGTVLGNGADSNGLNAGVAPEAKLLFQSVARDNGAMAGIPWYLPWLFDEVYAEEIDGQAAKIHTNSWGMPGSTGLYSYYSLSVDEFMWNHPEFLIIFASGNEGTNGEYSVLAPATAKNALTVGATDNLVDSPNVLSAYSGRGPTRDGRVKPDIVAPGSNIVSTASQLRFDDSYVVYNGTSMATPHVAGAAALVREYLADNGNTLPSASLVKAMLVNGAYDIGLDAASTVTATRPTNEAGWGRLDLENTFALENGQSVTYWDSANLDTSKNAVALATGEQNIHTLPVYSSEQPLRVTLAWTDYPGTTAANGALVNDLDLHVVQPDGSIIYPNHANGGGNDDGYDHVNNLVGIDINAPQVGEYQIVVRGYNVAMAPQPYSVVVSGGLTEEAPSDSSCELAIDGAGSYSFCELGLTLEVLEESVDTIRVTAIDALPALESQPVLMANRYYQVEVISADADAALTVNATFQYDDLPTRTHLNEAILGAYQYDGQNLLHHMPEMLDAASNTMTLTNLELSDSSDWGFGANGVPTSITMVSQTAFSFANYLTKILTIFTALLLITTFSCIYIKRAA